MPRFLSLRSPEQARIVSELDALQVERRRSACKPRPPSLRYATASRRDIQSVFVPLRRDKGEL